MSRRSRKESEGNLREAIEEVLRGRSKPRVEKLLGMIAQINPTGQDLPEPQMKERYAQKSRLQSLLIRWYPDSLVVLPVAGQTGVVGLRHRHSDFDACHAVIDELDEEARSWVRLQLDTQSEGEQDDGKAQKGLPVRVTPAQEPSSPAFEVDTQDAAALLKAGLGAREEYDYEAARQYLTAAVERSGKAQQPVNELLTLFVEYLGEDEEALALARRLPPPVLRDAGARLLLATAAARRGLKQEALSYVRGLEDHRAGEVVLILFDQAIQAGASQEAKGLLSDAQKVGANPTAVHERQKRLDGLLAEQYGEVELGIEKMWEREDREGAAKKARELLEIYPESKVARRILRAFQDDARSREAADALARALDALAHEELDAAIGLFHRALDLGASSERVNPILAEAAARRERRELESAVSRVSGLLGAEDATGGLLAYLQLRDEARSRIRAAVPRRELHWLEQMKASQLNAKKQEAAVSAVLALSRADSALTAGNAEEALRLIAGHHSALEKITEASWLQEQARQWLERQRGEAAAALLVQAGEALSADDPARARALLQRLDLRALTSEQRTLAQGLQERLGRREELLSLAKRVELNQEKQDWLAAREIVDEILERGTGEQTLAWQQKRSELLARIQEQFRVLVIENVDESADVLVELEHLPVSESPQAWLLPGGRELFYAGIFGPWLFLQRIDIELRKIKQMVMLRAPVKMDSYINCAVDPERVQIVDMSGNLLILKWATWDVEGFYPLQEMLSQKYRRIEDIIPLPSSRFIWVVTESLDRLDRIFVIDTRARRVHREIEKESWRRSVVLADEPVMFMGLSPLELTAMQDRGAVLKELIYKADEDETVTFAPLPESKGYVVLSGSLEYGEEELYIDVSLWWPDGRRSDPVRLKEGDIEMLHGLATSRSKGLVFAYYMVDQSTAHLVAFRVTNDQLIKLYQVPAPTRAALVQDEHAQHVALLFGNQDGLSVITLGENPPEFANAGKEREGWPNIEGPYMCAWYEKLAKDDRYGHIRGIDQLSPAEREKMLQKDFERCQDNLDRLASFLHSLRTPYTEEQARFMKMALERHPSNPTLMLLAADQDMRNGRWESIPLLIESMDDSSLPPDACSHRYHLLGMAAYMRGDQKGALEHWLKSFRIDESHCRLDALIDLVSPLHQQVTPEDWDPKHSLVLRLRYMIYAADLALEHEDLDRVLQILDHPLVLRIQEVQSLARLATAYLSVKAVQLERLFRKALVLAMFVRVQEESNSYLRKELQLPDNRWDTDRLNATRSRAQEWLSNKEWDGFRF